MTRDTQAAVAYYKNTAGWEFSDMPMEDSVYHLAIKNGRPVAGIIDISAMEHLAGVPSHWFTYIAVNDVDAAVKETEKAGGKILRPVFEVPGTGRIAIITDPTGAAVGLMTPDISAYEGKE